MATSRANTTGAAVMTGNPGKARCQCCKVRAFTWGHPAGSADWHLYGADAATTPHCRWHSCVHHPVHPPGGQGMLCPHAYADKGAYYDAHPPKGGRTFKGRRGAVAAPEVLTVEDRNGKTITVVVAAPVTPRRQRTQRAPVTPQTPAPWSQHGATAATAPSVPLDADAEGMAPEDDPLSFLVDEDSGVIPAESSDYVPQDGEVEAIERAIRLEQNVLVLGPPGCGKTQLLRTITARLARVMVTVLGADGTPRDEIVGRRDLVNGATVWRDGLIPAAMRAGHVLYIDEVNALPAGIRSACYSALDSRREITLAENGNEVVRAVAGFVCVASMNAEGFAGTTPLAPPLQQRFGCIVRLDYLPADREARLLRARVPGLTARDAALMVAVAGKIREAKTIGKKLNRMAAVGTRTLLDWAARVVDGEDVRRAASLTVGGLTLDPVEYKVVMDTVDATAPEAPAQVAR